MTLEYHHQYQHIQDLHHLQQKVDESIRKLGGYWRPLSTLARFMEEMGEVAELLHPLLDEQTRNKSFKREKKQQELGEELADLFIISTCLANQYCADLEEEHTKLGDVAGAMFDQEDGQRQTANAAPSVAGYDSDLQSLWFKLIIQGGKVARIVNHYEGDKKKKKSERTQSVVQEISKFQLCIIQLANAAQVGLLECVHRVVDRNLKRDQGRFDMTHDPITEPARDKFQVKVKNDQAKRKLWGMSQREEQSTEENHRDFQHILTRFVKCGQAEGLAGIVLELKKDGIEHDSTGQKETFAQTFLSGVLKRVDHGVSSSNRSEKGGYLSLWKYEDVLFQITIFHFTDHPQSLFVLLQPSYSVHKYGDIALGVNHS